MESFADFAPSVRGLPQMVIPFSDQEFFFLLQMISEYCLTIPF